MWVGNFKMTLNLQYENGRLIVFVVMNKERIQSICDTLGTAQDLIEKLSKLGFTRDDMIIEGYRMMEN